MKICMVLSTPFPPEEGIGYHVYNLSKKLIERGHDVTTITRGSFHLSKNHFEGIDVIRTPYIPIYPFHVHFQKWMMKDLIRSIEKNYDLIHIHTPLSPPIQSTLPIITTIHTSVAEDAKYIQITDFKSLLTKIMTRPISMPLISKTIQNSDLVTTVAHSVAKEIVTYFGFKDTIVTGNGVDETLFKPPELRGKSKNILFVGRLSYRKGIFTLLASAEQICNKYDVTFTLVGKGELEVRIRDYIRERNLEEKIKLMGHVSQEELIKIYQNALIFVMPSHYEGLPTVLLEAMSCGLPVIATRVSGNLDVIKNNENGVFIQPGSSDDLTSALSSLLQNDELRKKIGMNARDHILNHATWGIITDRIEACYRGIMGSA